MNFNIHVQTSMEIWTQKQYQNISEKHAPCFRPTKCTTKIVWLYIYLFNNGQEVEKCLVRTGARVDD